MRSLLSGSGFKQRWPAPPAAVAVGTRVSSRAPRTEPYVRLSRIRLPPRVCDGEAIARPRVEDDRFRKPVVRQLRHPCPCDPILLAAKPPRAPPEVDHMVPEHVQCPRIGGHCVMVEVAADDVPQPLSLFGNWLMHAPPHLLFDHLELRLHAVSPGLPLDLEFALASLAADEGEAQEVEGLRLAEPAPLAAFRRKASELNEDLVYVRGPLNRSAAARQERPQHCPTDVANSIVRVPPGRCLARHAYWLRRGAPFLAIIAPGRRHPSKPRTLPAEKSAARRGKGGLP